MQKESEKKREDKKRKKSQRKKSKKEVKQKKETGNLQECSEMVLSYTPFIRELTKQTR